MKKVFKSAVMLMAAFMLPLGFTSCSSNDDPVANNDFTNKAYGQDAMDACDELCNALRAAYSKVNDAHLSADQETYLKNVCANAVDNTIQPTYKSLADAVEKLHTALPKSVDTNNLTQENINNACAAFKDARALWEKSEAFLGGAASDFDIDPHIDSWPLNRTALLSYFKNPTAKIDDESILGFHALEFILFRDGNPRNVSEFKGNDTYKGFENISGADELKYAETVIEDLLAHVYELQCSWQDTPDAARLNVVTAKGLAYRTQNYNKSYGWNIQNYGDNLSTFPTLEAALEQILSADEGSGLAIANEVGNKKIANPFTLGDISYVESPYSYNSITDFQDNIRSIENVWYGGRNGASSNPTYSFHKFFVQTNPTVAKAVEDAIANAINNIGKMPSPFVKYVSVLWNKNFVDAPLVDYGDE